jgi:hypothetical protein
MWFPEIRADGEMAVFKAQCWYVYQTNTITGMKPDGSLAIDNPAPLARLYA